MFKEERWSAEFELDNVVAKKLLYTINAQYESMGSLIELQVNLAREYDGTIVKVIFNKEGKPTKLFYNYEKDENTFNSIQTYKYKNTNDLIEVREYKLKNRYEKVIFVKDTNIILGNYELEGYMKFIFKVYLAIGPVQLRING